MCIVWTSLVSCSQWVAAPGCTSIILDPLAAAKQGLTACSSIWLNAWDVCSVCSWRSACAVLCLSASAPLEGIRG
jgi:hypothetical protein